MINDLGMRYRSMRLASLTIAKVLSTTGFLEVAACPGQESTQ
jgi:hypothetical protein